MNDNLLTIAVATNTKKLQDLVNQLELDLEKLDETICFLLVYQSPRPRSVSFKSARIKVVYNSESGISSNRNCCIVNSVTPWVWFQDDDIVLNHAEVNRYASELSASSGDVQLCQIGSLENRTEYYKNYSNRKQLPLSLLAFKISSIELICSTSFIKRNEISFDENLGLGTDLPCCEENLFFRQLLNSNAKVDLVDRVLCFHTTLREGRLDKSLKHLKARGYLLYHCSLPLGLPLAMRWCYREINGLGFFQSMLSVYNGYKLGRRNALFDSSVRK
jgi:glycosyltransferase involved in cell wall biosynthesis